MSAPIQASKYHTDVTKDFFTELFPAPGTWSVETKGVSLKGADALIANPTIASTGLKVQVEAVSSKIPVAGLTFGATVTNKGGVDPVINYKGFCPKAEGTHKVKAFPRSGILEHEFANKDGVFSTTFKTALFDWVSTSASVSARLNPDVIGAFSFDLDPFRSGIKNYILSLKYKNNAAISYNATGGLLLTGKHTCEDGQSAFVAVKSTRTRKLDVTAGTSYTTKSGAILNAFVGVPNSDIGLSVTKMFPNPGNWKMTAAFKFNAYDLQVKPEVGINLVREA